MSEAAPWEDAPIVDDSTSDTPWESSPIVEEGAPVSGETFPGQDMTGVPIGEENPLTRYTKGTMRDPAQMKPVRGFDKIDNIIHLMKTESIPKNLINWLTTPEDTYRKKERIEKDELINSIPIVSQIRDRLDEIEWVSSQEGYKGNLEDEHNKLIDAYGTLYQSLEKAHDNGELGTGFSWDAFTDAVADDPTGMLGEIANVFMADPVLLLTPIGWEAAASKSVAIAKTLGASSKVENMAKVTGGITGSATLGGGLATVDNISRQLGEKGKVDMDEVADAATIGAIAAPILIGGFKGAKVGVGKGYGKMSDIKFNSSFKKAIKRIEKNAQMFMAKGLKDPQRAIERGIDASFIPTKVREALAERHDWIRKINLSDAAIQAKHIEISKFSNTYKSKLYKMMSTLHRGAQDFFGNLSTEMGLIHPQLRHAVKQLDHRTSVALKHGLDIKDKFKSVNEGLSPNDKTLLHIALGNGNKKAITKIIDRSNASAQEKATIQTTMDAYFKDVFNRTEAAGMGLKQRENFFPMGVTDYVAFAHYLGFSPDYIGGALSKAINKKFKLSEGNKVKSYIDIKAAEEFLSSDEIAQVLNKALRSPFKGTSTKTTHSKPRVIEHYNEDNIKFYDPPVKMFADYVTSMEPKIQETMFFGGKQGADIPHSGFITNSIGSMVKKLADNGDILPDDMQRLGDLLTARFVEGTRAPKKIIGGIKNILYAATLGNPFSAATQMGDLGNSAYIVGTMDTLKTIPMVMGGKGVFKMEDFGLNNIVQEFEHLGPTARILDVSLKWSGFKAVDRLGKEVTLNATFAKYTKIAKSIQNTSKGVKKTKGSKEFIKTYQDAFTPEAFNKVIDDLAKGNHTPDVKYLLWHELTRVQPISLSEMPVKYLQHPNARMFYMLKTFTLKQMDLVRREAYQKIRSGDVAGGMKNLARWTGILGISNSSVEQAKAWVRGDEVEFGDLVYAQMFKNYGMSQYILDQAASGRPVAAMAMLIVPPIGIFDEPWQDLANFGERFETLKYVPVFGKGMYYLFDVGDK